MTGGSEWFGPMDPGGKFRRPPNLWCGLLKVEIDPVGMEVTFYLPKGHCVSSEAVNIAERLLPGVRRVVTMAGDEPDMRYEADPADAGRGGWGWRAYLPQKARRLA